MAGRREPFPLAVGLARLVDAQIPDLVAGLSPDLLTQVTATTAELLRFWFEQDHCDLRRHNFHHGQRSALLHIIYAHEVIGARTPDELYAAVTAAPAPLGTGRDQHGHPTYAVKMATGTGKTWVLNALLVWQYLNRTADPRDERFTSHFLLVAPGLIVYDRLLESLRGKAVGGRRDYTTSDLYRHRELFVPQPYRDEVFSFVQSSVVTRTEIGRTVTGSGLIAITNWQLLAGEDPQMVDTSGADGASSSDGAGGIDAKAAAASFVPLTPGTAAGNALDALDRRHLRGVPLRALIDLPDLLVFNDEAHHLHELRQADRSFDVQWQRSLHAMASTKAHRFIQIDLSATPYHEVGEHRRYFRHIVADFELTEAMRTGLVKVVALERGSGISSLSPDFTAERDGAGRVTGLSNGQRSMLRAGLARLHRLADSFATVDPGRHPKLLVLCEDTTVTPHVVDFLRSTGLAEADILRVDSGRRREIGAKDWDAVRARLSDVDHQVQPAVIVSVLMLREGFDVDNIAVIVPLRSSSASILLEQTIGRGLRLMWRGDDTIDELKRDTRERIAQGREPGNHFDVLFVVEHPAFARFYAELLGGGLVGQVGDEPAQVTGDLVHVHLRPGYQAYDIEVPTIVRAADEPLTRPHLDPMSLPGYERDAWAVAESATPNSGRGDHRVDGGVLTATGYHDYLSRMTARLALASGHALTGSAGRYRRDSRYPTLVTHRPRLAGWLDVYIRRRLFGPDFDPLAGENWRVLVVPDVAQHILTTFATGLSERLVDEAAASAIVHMRRMSERTTIPVRATGRVEVRRCIYPALAVPSVGATAQRRFIEWLDRDDQVEALARVYDQDFLRRPYLKADGTLGRYAPDFLVRTRCDVYLVQTRAWPALGAEDVLRLRRAAVAWCGQLNDLPPDQRGHRRWHYVRIDERTLAGGSDASAAEVLARLG